MAPTAALLLVLGLAAPCGASVAEGGTYELETSLVGASGGGLAQEGALSAVIAIGDWSLAVSELGGSDLSGWSGYLSAVRPPDYIGPRVVGVVAPVPAAAGCSPAAVPAGGEVRVVFSRPVNPSSLANTFSAEAALESGESLFQPLALTYDTTEQLAVLSPVPNWPNSAEVTVRISTQVTDIYGLHLVPFSAVTFRTFHPTGVATTVRAVAEPGLEVDVPPGTFQDSYFITLCSSAPAASVERANRKLEEALGKRMIRSVEITAYDASGGLVSSFGGQVTLRIPYADADGDGVVDALSPPVRASTLGIWRLDEMNDIWVRQSAGLINPAGRSASIGLQSFSVYALVGGLDANVDSIFAFPVPFRPNAGDPARFGTWAGGITFVNMPTQGTLRIYDLSGQKVRELPVGPAATLKWDVLNEQGERVGSGVYLWEVRSDGNRKTGKLMVIK